MNNCIGVRNHKVFLVHLIVIAIILCLDIVPPITFFSGGSTEEENFYDLFCVLCKNYIYTRTINAL